MTNVSRRQILSLGTVSLGLGGLVKTVSAAEAKTIKWNETTGFLIIGTGFAGLAAALEAHQIGMKSSEIMVVDKMPTAGGNSIINGGAVAAAGTDMQEKDGIKDSPDLMYKDILKASGGLCHPELARRISDESVENFLWLRDKIGVKFKTVYYHGGHSVKRSHAVTINSGAGFINPMLAKLEEYGTTVFIRATKGVLLASGGFSQNVKMRMSHDPRLTAAFTSTNHPGATGEMIQEAQEIGANTVQMDWIQLGP